MVDPVILVPVVAMKVFDYSEFFTSMLNGFAEIENHVMGHQWKCGVARDSHRWVCQIKFSAQFDCLNSAHQVFAEMVEQGIPSSTYVIHGFGARGYSCKKKHIHVDLSCLSISLIQLMQMNKNVSFPNTITSMFHENSKHNHLSKSLKFFNKTLEKVHIMFNFVSGA